MNIYNFYKYQGTGNDFIILDNRTRFFDKNNIELVKKMCNRKFGIGADGLMLIENHPNADFDLIYFNSDGSQSFCGNGSRCAVAFAKKLRIVKKEATFNAIDGIHKAKVEGDLIHLKMGNTNRIESIKNDYFVNTGSPHYIQFVDDIAQVNIIEKAHIIRYNDRFKKEGTNVNFVSVKGNEIAMRTYERGVENETLSCGTGATAVALAAHQFHHVPSPVTVQVEGGTLQIELEQKPNGKFHNIWLIGPAKHVFTGLIEL